MKTNQYKAYQIEALDWNKLVEIQTIQGDVVIAYPDNALWLEDYDIGEENLVITLRMPDGRGYLIPDEEIASYRQI